MTNSVSASRLTIADPRPQTRKDGSKDQSAFQDVFRTDGAERRRDATAGGPGVAVPSQGLARRLEVLTELGFRLSGKAADAAETATAKLSDGLAEALVADYAATKATTQPESDLPAPPKKGDLRRVEKSDEAADHVRPGASMRAPRLDLQSGRISAQTDDAGPAETEAAAEEAIPAFALVQDAPRVPRQPARSAAEETSSPALATAREHARIDDAEATARTGAPKSAAASLSPASPVPLQAQAAGKAETATPFVPNTPSREVPIATAQVPSAAHVPVGTIAAPPAQATPRAPGTDRTGTRAGDGTAAATSAGRDPSAAANARLSAEAGPASPSPETADKMPPPREQVEREAKDDGRKPNVSDARAGETSRPAPNGVTAVSAQSAQAAAPATPAAAIIAAVRAEASWATYFRDTQPGAPTQIKSLKIQLNPVELGAVTAHLRIKDDAVTVELSAETADAQRQLTSDADKIIKSLRALGLDVDRVTVQLAARSDAQPQAEPAGQSRQPGFAAEDGAGGAHGQDGGSQGEQRQSGGQAAPTAGPPGGASSRSSSARYI